MFTSIKQRDLNTPLLQRIEKKLLEKRKLLASNTNPDINSLSAEYKESLQVSGTDISRSLQKEAPTNITLESNRISPENSSEKSNDGVIDPCQENGNQELTANNNDVISEMQPFCKSDIFYEDKMPNSNFIKGARGSENINDSFMTSDDKEIPDSDPSQINDKLYIHQREGTENVYQARKKAKKCNFKSETKSKLTQQVKFEEFIETEDQKYQITDRRTEESMTSNQNMIHITKELLDNFHIQFEDESPGISNVNFFDKKVEDEGLPKKGQRRKSRRSMDFTPDKPLLLEPRESNGTPTVTPNCTKSNNESADIPNSNKSSDASTRRKKTRKRRVSADVEILKSEVKFSPDIELEGLDEMKTLPGTRRSRRLQRQSIELCRRNPSSSLPAMVDEDEDPVLVTADQAALSPFSLVEQVHSEKVQNYEENIQDKENSNSVTEITSTNLSHNNSQNKTDSKSNKEPQGRKRSYTKRNAKTKVSYVEEDIVENEVEVKKPKVKSGKRKRKREEEGPSVEDIYFNKLWKNQMPDPEKTWETIYEIPQNKCGKEDFYSAKRYRRALSYEHFYTQQKLKRRRQKASKLGYKPLTKKKHEKFDQLVAEKLALLEDELSTFENGLNASVATDNVIECGDELMNETCPSLQGKQTDNFSNVHDESARTEINEETFYTPMKTIYDKEFKKGSEIDNISDNKNSLSEHTDFGDRGNSFMSDSEDVFQTPQKTPEHWKIKYDKVNEMSLIEEEFESSSCNNSQDFCLRT